MVLKQQNVCPQNPVFSLDDALLCDEKEHDLGLDSDSDLECGSGLFDQESQILKQKDPLFTNLEQDLLWGQDELSSLLSKEKNTHPGGGGLICDGVLMSLRNDSVNWMIRVGTHYGFVAKTTSLAVNYLDRFLLSPNFQKDKPWMSQLASVACLSIASKFEEIQAPLLLDLQVEGSKFVFESKTIMKMELLVLSSLQWRMNSITPLAFFDYLMRRLGLITHCLHSEFLRRCERIVLATINDSRYLGYLPSVIAAATMCIVIKEIDPGNASDFQSQLKGLLEISEEVVDDCSKFISEASGNHNHKQKYHSAPGSPNGVIDCCFNSDNSNDSWAFVSSVSSSPEPPFKKSRVQEQQMRLTPVNRVPIGVLNDPPR